MLMLWHLASGYVRVLVTGFGIERFLNMVAFHGVYLWDIERVPDGIYLNVSIKGFKMLKTYSRKTKCRTKIIEKNGLPFLVFRYRRRKLLMGGVLFFVLGLFMLSSFVWRIEIIGNETVHSESVSAFLHENGLHIGTPKWRMNELEIQASIMSNFPEISWADVHTRGTRTTVMIAEAIPPQEIIDRTLPAHVVAVNDGLITSIVTASGAPVVRQGDVVRAGELLVSGELELDPENPESPRVYVHAYAEVWAKRYHPIEFTVPLTYSARVYTGRIIRHRELHFLFAENARLPLPRGRFRFESYERVTTHHQPGVGGDYPLPVVLVTEHFAEFIPEERERTVEMAKEIAQVMITGRIMREFDFAIDVIAREVEFEEVDGGVIARALITTHERIDKQVGL